MTVIWNRITSVLTKLATPKIKLEKVSFHFLKFSRLPYLHLES